MLIGKKDMSQQMSRGNSSIFHRTRNHYEIKENSVSISAGRTAYNHYGLQDNTEGSKNPLKISKPSERGVLKTQSEQRQIIQT